MHVARKTNQELVIVDSSVWLAISLLVGSVLLLFRTADLQAKPINYVAIGFLVLCGLIFWRREVVVFDASRQQAQWTRRRFFKVASGVIPFSDITGIGMESTSAKNNALVYRLSILTVQGSTPMADNYSGNRQKYEDLRLQITVFLHLDSGDATSAAASGIDDEASIRSLLEQGRRIDAIRLVRETQKIGLADATDRVAAIYEQMKAAK